VNLFSALDRKLLRDLVHMRGQALAVGVIIACGVGILIMALGALQSLQQSREIYYEHYRFADVFADVKRAPERLASEIRQIDGVQQVETRISRIVTLDIARLEEPANGQLVSIPDDEAPILNGVLLYEGRWPDQTRPDEAVVSKAFAEANALGIGDSVSAIINGRARDVTLVGIGDSPEYIYTLGPGALLPDDERFGVFWMRRRALEAAFDLDGAFSSVSVTLAGNTQPENVIAELDILLAPFAGVGAYARDDQISHAFIESEMQQLRSMARVIPPVFLVVSAILIHAILSRLIATERQQIGLLKAFGYTRAEIGWHYVKFALVLSGGGVLAGFVMGWALAGLLTHLYSDTFRFPDIILTLAPASFLIGAVAAFSAAIAGALTSALRAASLAPAEAMSPAPPTIYRRGFLERLSGAPNLDAPTRMIARHLTRWPLRAGMTMFGIAASVALLVGTLFAFDSVDAMLDTRFNRTDAYDAAVNFVEPQGTDALLELGRLPGVLEVEGNRNIYVRLRHGSHDERAVIVGLQPDGHQKQLLDAGGQIVPVPERGLALSNQMASMISAGRGDRVTVVVLEGRRPVVDVPVTAIVAEDIGAFAYMDIRQVNRLLGERPTVTGAFLAIDPDQNIDFSEQVLARPRIASVSMQEPAIAAFETTLEETIYIMMAIYALIGGSIAAGVVYNAARIAMMERGRELASLRVLGFTEGEVIHILLGELAILIMIALPVGAVFGLGFANLIVSGMSTELYRIPFALQPSTYGLAGIIVLVASIGSAILVARRVRDLDLIEVLKTRE
jgi:putative ABC transport system permease protein